MKKLIFACIALLFTLTSFAQSPVQTMTNDNSAIVNSGTVSSTKKLNAPARTVTVETVVTKVSGTVGGTVVLQGSLDGTNWHAAGADTLTLANQTTNKKIWLLTENRYYHYRTLATGSGTMNATVVSLLLPRQ